METKSVLVSQNRYTVDEEVFAKYKFSDAQREKIRDLVKQQNEFHGRMKNNKKLLETERYALSTRSLEDAGTWAERAEQSHTQMTDQYKRGFRRWVKKGQNFSSFIDDIEPILDVAKNVDPTISFAIGTICGLFAIIGRKGAAEEQAIRIVDGIKDRLPGCATYQNIYREDGELEIDLQKKIILVYVAFIELSMAVTKYCLSSSLTTFTQLDDCLNAQLDSVKSRCEELQSLRIAELKDLNQKMLIYQERLVADNEKLLKKLEVMELDRTSEHLIHIRKLLGLGSWSMHSHRSNLEDYMASIDAERKHETVYEQMVTGSIQRYRKSSNFSEWEVPGQSAVLMLQAYNHDAIPPKRHCWVSPLALDVHKRLATTGSAPHAIYAFDPLQSNESIFDAIPNILLQLIEHSRSKLLSHIDRREALVVAIKEYEGINPPTDPKVIDDEKAKALYEVAKQVIKLFDSTSSVYLILDRVDLCLTRDHYCLIETIRTMIRAADCVVKVLIVSNGSSWDSTPRDFNKFTICIREKLRQEYFMRY